MTTTVRDELIRIRTILDIDVPKAKQALTILIKEMQYYPTKWE